LNAPKLPEARWYGPRCAATREIVDGIEWAVTSSRTAPSEASDPREGLFAPCLETIHPELSAHEEIAGRGQDSDWNSPEKPVVDAVLLGGATGCVHAPPATVLQTEEGSPTGPATSFRGFSVGNIVISTTGDGSYTVSADGKVTEGPDEVGAAGLPVTMLVDD
jgi:hypothetical protein